MYRCVFGEDLLERRGRKLNEEISESAFYTCWRIVESEGGNTVGRQSIVHPNLILYFFFFFCFEEMSDFVLYSLLISSILYTLILFSKVMIGLVFSPLNCFLF